MRFFLSHYKLFTPWGSVLMTADLSSSCSADIKSDINNNLPVMTFVCKHVLTQIRLWPPGGAEAPPELTESRRVCSSESAAAIPRLFKEAVALRLSLRNAALITHAGPSNVPGAQPEIHWLQITATRSIWLNAGTYVFTFCTRMHMRAAQIEEKTHAHNFIMRHFSFVKTLHKHTETLKTAGWIKTSAGLLISTGPDS